MQKIIKYLIYFKNPFYNFLLEKRASPKMLFSPEDYWGGDSEVGQKIIDGYINFYGESFSFKKNIWETNQASEFWNGQLHSFDWLRDVRAVGTNKARVFVRFNILEWLKKNKNWDNSSWKNDILARRIINLLGNLSFYFNTAEDEFQIKLAKNINKQALFLHDLQLEKILRKNRIFVIKALILSSLTFENLKNKLSLGLNWLDKIISEDLFEDGMHYSRSPSEHFFFLRSLIDIKNYLGTFRILIPKNLNSKISVMTSILKFFRIGDGQLGIFNNYENISNTMIEKVIKRANSKIKTPNQLAFSGFQRISENRLTLIMDCGEPPKEKTYASSLSFELSHGGEKIVVNSGSPYVNNRRWNDSMRSTAAHSTVSVNDINSSDIFFNKDTTTRLAKVKSERLQDKDSFWINSAHDGYEKVFGIIHCRKIHIDCKNLIIRGEDFFLKSSKKKSMIPKKIYIRFHIHPSVRLSVTSSKKKAVLMLKNNLGWEFISSEPKIKIKEGIYLGENKIVEKNNNILISDEYKDEKKIKWLFRLIQ